MKGRRQQCTIFMINLMKEIKKLGQLNIINIRTQELNDKAERQSKRDLHST
jgi:hypothetical protein